MSIRWPNPLDYSEAVQIPEVSFEDAELQSGECELTPMGLPKVASGNFASVFRFDCGAKSYAVKCFLRNVYDQHQRYNQLTQFTTTSHVPHMVDFEYQLKGIRIEDNWFPIVKMQWVDGLGLDQFVRKNWSNKAQINRVIAQFSELMLSLQQLGISHCDLQHGNVLVKDDGIKLVDYDGMFVPAMAGQPSAELGHANYQHLERSDRNFGPDLDNFSAWIIYYSLFFLKLDPSLWQRFSGGDDCLLFRKSDFANPDSSRLVLDIANHAIPDIKAQAAALRAILKAPITQVPRFSPPGSNGSGGPSQAGRQTGQQTDGGPGAAKPIPIYPAKWPTVEQYFWASVRPAKAYSDEKLAKALPVPTQGKTTSQIEVDATTQEHVSLQKTVIKGRNHMVLHMVGEEGTRHYAVKCFLYDLPDRHVRYSAIHRHKKTASNRYFVPFVYQPAGIWVNNCWMPILKMLWIKGESLEDYVRKQMHVGNAGAMEELARKWLAMVTALAADGIAHGDLEPTNILVDEAGELKIVDYDAMYVPALASLQACESGFKLYQHSTRNLTNFGNYLDNYSALAIYGLLSCMTRNPPERFWNWDNLLQHIRSQPPQLRPEGPKRPSDGFLIPKQKFGSKDKAAMWKELCTPDSPSNILFNPVFEKATIADATQAPISFDSSVQRLARVLQEQQKRRIDQVSNLDLTMWNLA